MVTVYTKPQCAMCDCTKRKLTDLGVPFTAVDITDDPAALDYVMALGYSSAPVVVAGTEHWAGFRPDRLNRLAARGDAAA